MLSLFRSVVCRTVPTRSLASLAHPYSTAPDQPSRDTSKLVEILEEEGDRQDNDASDLNPSLTDDPWNDWRKNAFVQPHHFSMKARTGRSRGPAAPLIGPGRKQSRHNDVFHQLAIDPLHECRNAALLSGFVTRMGKIKHRRETGLTQRSQRRLSKAIRRAKMMGVIPVLSHSHPSLR